MLFKSCSDPSEDRISAPNAVIYQLLAICYYLSVLLSISYYLSIILYLSLFNGIKREVWVGVGCKLYRWVQGHSPLQKCLILGALKCTQNEKHSTTLYQDMKAQLRELAKNDMLTTMFPNLSALSNVCFSIPVSIASIERS